MSGLLSDVTTSLTGLSVGLIPVVVLLLAFIGSPHCLLMCGPICYVAGQNDKTKQSLYHLGRLLSYLLVGGIFGLVGGVLLKEIQGGLLLLSTVLLSVLFALSGLSMILNKKSTWVQNVVSAITNTFVRRAARVSERARAFIMGSVSGFLPCGFLFTFLLAALATQSAFTGGLLLFFFWLGTVPALSSGLYFLKRLRSRFPAMQNTFRVSMGALFILYALLILWPRVERAVSPSGSEISAKSSMICE